MFWCNQVKIISKKLWIPKLNIKSIRNNGQLFNYYGKNISSKYYPSDTAVSNKVKFVPLKFRNFDFDKMLLEQELYDKELNRFCTEINKTLEEDPYDDIPDIVLNKHFDMNNKNITKVSNLDRVIRSFRYQIMPDIEQKKVIKKWYRDAIRIYNKLVFDFTNVYDSIKDKHDNTKDICAAIRKNEIFPLNFYNCRKKYNIIFDNEYILDIPYNVRANIIKDFISNVKGNLTKMSIYKINNFKFNLSNLLKNKFTITIEKSNTNKNGFYVNTLGNMNIKGNQIKWEDIMCDYKLSFIPATGKFFIYVPKYVDKKNVKNRNSLCSMDPGERVFQVLYGLDHIIKIGVGISDIFRKKLLKIDSLNKKKELATSRKEKTKYNKAISKIHSKMDNIQTEFHSKICLFLCKNYDRIMVTNFSSQKVGRKNGNLNKMSKRVLGKLSHYNFRKRLESKCEEYKCQYIEVTEEYTSKTCGKCGNLNNNLGSKKIYECDKCKLIIDRDVNGARNILLKNNKLVILENK